MPTKIPHALTAHSVRYSGVMQGMQTHPVGAVARRLSVQLPRLWDLSYREMTRGDVSIVEVRQEGRVYRVDEAADAVAGERGRLVVAYGFSLPKWEKGDSSAGHARGGPADDDILPPRSHSSSGGEIGWSPRGTSIRDMQLWCAEHPGSFYFVRPIYMRGGAVPHALEVGVLRSASDLWVERFPN